MKKSKGCLISIDIFALILFTVISIGVLTDWGTIGKPILLEFEEIECKISDTGTKSQVVRHVVLKDTLAAPEQIQYLTETLVDATKKTKMKYHNGMPTHIFIYLHKSKESYKSGIWVNCLATYIKVGADDIGKYSYQTLPTR